MDDARFDRQRRNVMVTSTVLLGAWFAGANFEKVQIFGLSALNAHRLEVLWTIVIAYFMWRLFQVTGNEQFDEVRDLYKNMFMWVMLRIGRKKVYRDCVGEAEKEARESDQRLISLKVSEENYKYDNFIFSAKYNVSTKSGSKKGETFGSTTRSVKFAIGDPEFSAGRIYALVLVPLRRKIFTEYVLPYLLGVGAVVVGLVGF